MPREEIGALKSEPPLLVFPPFVFTSGDECQPCPLFPGCHRACSSSSTSAKADDNACVASPPASCDRRLLLCSRFMHHRVYESPKGASQMLSCKSTWYPYPMQASCLHHQIHRRMSHM